MERSKRQEEYIKKLRDPRWQKMRLEIFERDGWQCTACSDDKSMLCVHHLECLPGRDPWDVPPSSLVTLCESCHNEETEQRPQEEANLLRLLRKNGFMASAIGEIVNGLEHSNITEQPYFIALMISWIFCRSDLQKELINKHICPSGD